MWPIMRAGLGSRDCKGQEVSVCVEKGQEECEQWVPQEMGKSQTLKKKARELGQELTVE